MKRKASSNIDTREQLIRALEYSILGWHHTIYSGNVHNSSDLLDLLNFFRRLELGLESGPAKNEEKSIGETSMKGYRNRLKEEFQFYVNFQSGFADFGASLTRTEKVKRILPLASYYLHGVLPSHSDEGLLLLLKNISTKDPLKGTVPADPLLALYYVIAFRMASLCGITVDFVYREVMGKTESSRRVVPLAVVWRAPYINLIARDKKDGKIKQFVMSSILSIKSDLWSDFFKVLTGKTIERESFDYEAYKKDPEYHFLRSIKKYTFRMTGHTFHHFRHSWNLNWELIEEKSHTEHIVSITSDDWRMMMNLLFNYGFYIELIEEVQIQKGSGNTSGDLPVPCRKKPLPLLCAFESQIQAIFPDHSASDSTSR